MAARLISAGNLRWLFAETFVIVLGVLIAFRLDDSWTNRQDRLLAIDYIQRLQDDVNEDLKYIRDTWLPRLRMKQKEYPGSFGSTFMDHEKAHDGSAQRIYEAAVALCKGPWDTVSVRRYLQMKIRQRLNTDGPLLAVSGP
jgi:hypothetical protein